MHTAVLVYLQGGRSDNVRRKRNGPNTFAGAKWGCILESDTGAQKELTTLGPILALSDEQMMCERAL
jgi:hypothetical protein